MKTILCVDDEPDQLLLLRLVLNQAGYRVLEAANGQEAIEMVTQHKPTLVLMDLMMPVMDGATATWYIRHNESTKHVPILILSAYRPEDMHYRALAVGADGFISKGLIPPDLMEAIKGHLSGGARGENGLLNLEVRIAEMVEAAYRLEVWRKNPQLAATLEQFTNLSSGIIHDLRNRLGVIQHYTPYGGYCLRLLEGMAFLRFKPALSQKLYGSDPTHSEILVKDLVGFGLDKKVALNLYRINHKDQKIGASALTVKGFVDVDLLSQGLWLFFQALTEYFAAFDAEQFDCPIEVTDKHLLDPQFGFYISISIPSRLGQVLPQSFDLHHIRLGDKQAWCLFLLHKIVFLHGGATSIKGDQEIEIKIKNYKKPPQLSIDTNKLTEAITTLSKQYTGVKTDVEALLEGVVSAISQELEDILAKKDFSTNGISKKRAREIVERNCRHAQLLLQNLLWLGTGIKVSRESVNVGAALQAVQGMLHSGIRGHSNDDDFIEVKLEVQPHLPPVLANRIGLQQVFMNLIINALEMMPETGTLTLRAFQVDAEVWAEISDTGNGIHPENIDHIFDLDFSTRQGRQYGVGLHIVQSIMDKLAGRIEVVSQLGKGATFRVCLPKN